MRIGKLLKMVKHFVALLWVNLAMQKLIGSTKNIWWQQAKWNFMNTKLLKKK